MVKIHTLKNIRVLSWQYTFQMGYPSEWIYPFVLLTQKWSQRLSYKSLGMDDKDLGRAHLFWAPRGWHGQKPTRELRCSLWRNLVLPSIRKVRISRSPEEAGIALNWRLVSSSQWQIKKSSVLGWGGITLLGRPIDCLGRFLILFIMVLLVFVTAYQLSMIDTWLFFSSLHFL